MNFESLLKRFGLDDDDIQSIQLGEITWDVVGNNELFLFHEEYGSRFIDELSDEEVVELLNAYQFDQRISKQPCRSSLFVNGTIDNWGGVNLKPRWDVLAEQYADASNILGAHIRNDGLEPYLFLCRHTLELRLKSIIMLGGKLFTASPKLPDHHELDKLWDDAFKIISSLKINFSNINKLHVDCVVNEFHKSDVKSFSFRYHVSKKNELIRHGNELFAFNVRKFGEAFRRSDQSLSAVIQKINFSLEVGRWVNAGGGSNDVL